MTRDGKGNSSGRRVAPGSININLQRGVCMGKRPAKAARLLIDGMAIGKLDIRFLHDYHSSRPLTRYINLASEATPIIGHGDEGPIREGRCMRNVVSPTMSSEVVVGRTRRGVRSVVRGSRRRYNSISGAVTHMWGSTATSDGGGIPYRRWRRLTFTASAREEDENE